MTSKEAILELICEAKSVNIDEGRICFLRNIIEKDLDRLEKLEKALETIKNKCATNTNIWLVVCTRTYEYYESFVENKDHKLVRLEHNVLTQQEFDLLKEVLE